MNKRNNRLGWKGNGSKPEVHGNHLGIFPGSIQYDTTAQCLDLLMIQTPPSPSTITGSAAGEEMCVEGLHHVAMLFLGISSLSHEHPRHPFDQRVFILLTWLSAGVRH